MTHADQLKVIPGRRYTKVAELDGPDGYASARWFFDTKTGDWFTAESWKRPNLRHRLNLLCHTCGHATMAHYDDGSSMCGHCFMERWRNR